MATLAGSTLTLADHAKLLDPTGKVSRVVELLDQMNAVYEDSVWKEGNLPTGHRVVVRKSLPTPTWRRLNQGVSPTKATTEQVDEQCGMLEDWSEVDKDLAELNGETNAFRIQHAKAHLEGIAQEWASTFFYGNHDTAQEEFTGIAPRYASPSGDTGQNIIDAGGSQSDNTSIYLVGWGDPVYCIYPKGSKAGVFHEDLGLQTVQTATGPGGGLMRAYQDHWQLKGGLCVEDWRYIVRIGSIDISSLIADGAGSSVKLMEYMLKAVHRLPRLDGGIRPAFYMNRTVGEMLDVQAMNKSNLYLMAGNEEGKRKLSFRGIPIRICDAITETESLV